MAGWLWNGILAGRAHPCSLPLSLEVPLAPLALEAFPPLGSPVDFFCNRLFVWFHICSCLCLWSINLLLMFWFRSYCSLFNVFGFIVWYWSYFCLQIYFFTFGFDDCFVSLSGGVSTFECVMSGSSSYTFFFPLFPFGFAEHFDTLFSSYLSPLCFIFSLPVEITGGCFICAFMRTLWELIWCIASLIVIPVVWNISFQGS